MKSLISILAALGLAGCGAGSTPAPSAAPAPIARAASYTALVVGGNEVFDRDVAGRLTPHNYGPCVLNAGVADGDSVAILGAFQLGILNAEPEAVVIVANAFELTYAEQWRTIDNLTGATLHASVTGAHVTLVGVAGASEFNDALRNVAAAYGATFAETVPEVSCK